jgi:hypothetical protein
MRKRLTSILLFVSILFASCNPYSLGKIRKLSSRASSGVQMEVNRIARIIYQDYIGRGYSKKEAYEATIDRLYDHFQNIQGDRIYQLERHDLVNVINIDSRNIDEYRD